MVYKKNLVTRSFRLSLQAEHLHYHHCGAGPYVVLLRG